MTSRYNRSEIVQYNDLTEEQQKKVLDDYSFELSDAQSTGYVILDSDVLPLSMFMRTDNNKFTHGIYSTSAFDGYFITLSRQGDCATIAYKHF